MLAQIMREHDQAADVPALSLVSWAHDVQHGQAMGRNEDVLAIRDRGMRRYALSDEKTFASLFHPDKEAILRLIDAFVRKDGKYAIPGYGHKLGLLLHGPPGTGKTSLIKARSPGQLEPRVGMPSSNTLQRHHALLLC